MSERVLSVRGELEMLYKGREDPKPNDMSAMCRIRRPDGQVSDPIPVQQALKWGYWEPPPKTGSKAKGRWRILKDGRRVMVSEKENI